MHLTACCTCITKNVRNKESWILGKTRIKSICKIDGKYLIKVFVLFLPSLLRYANFEYSCRSYIFFLHLYLFNVLIWLLWMFFYLQFSSRCETKIIVACDMIRWMMFCLFILVCLLPDATIRFSHTRVVLNLFVNRLRRELAYRAQASTQRDT